MRFTVLMLIILGMAASLSYADIIVNEIMYDPFQNENYNEWIELYNNGTENKEISNLTICGDRISPGYVNKSGFVFLNNITVIKSYGYAVITDGGSGTEVYDNFNVSNDSTAFHVDANSICGGLSNTGKEIGWFFENRNFSINYTNSANEGYTLELLNESFIQSNESGGTPGRKNTANISQINNSQNNSSGSSNDTGELDIAIEISKNNITLSEEILIYGNITTTFSLEKNASLTIKVARNISNTWSYKWYILENENITITENKTLSEILGRNLSWRVPDDFIIGDYKMLATLEYQDGNSSKHRYSDQVFYVNGLEDLGEYNLTIIESPKSMNFGGISKIVVRLDSNNYRLKNASFVAYIYDPRWASIDFTDNTLMSRPYETNVAVKFDNINRGSVNYVAIPILSKRNCENDYDSGTYKAKVRLYENDDELLETFFELNISGRNEDMCPKSETKYITKSSSSIHTIPSEKSISNNETVSEDFKFTYDNTKFEIFMPKFAKSDDIEVNISSNNPTNETKTFEIWSYLYSGNKLVTKRYENKKEIILEENRSESINLKTTLDGNYEGGEYKLFLKINSSNRKTEKTLSQDIVVIEDKSDGIDFKNITGFYLKTKKYDKETSLMSGCTDAKNSSNYSLTLYSSERYEIKQCNKTVEFKIRLREGGNMFFIALEKNNTIYDMKKMLIILNKTSIESYSDTKAIYERLNSQNMLDEIYKGSILTGDAIRSGSVIYESSNEKVKKLIKYMLPTVFVIGIVLFMRRKNG